MSKVTTVLTISALLIGFGGWAQANSTLDTRNAQMAQSTRPAQQGQQQSAQPAQPNATGSAANSPASVTPPNFNRNAAQPNAAQGQHPAQQNGAQQPQQPAEQMQINNPAQLGASQQTAAGANNPTRNCHLVWNRSAPNQTGSLPGVQVSGNAIATTMPFQATGCEGMTIEVR